MNLQALYFPFLILYIDKKLNFFDFLELYFSDFLSVKFLFILHFRFFSSFLSFNLNFFYFEYINA